MLLVYLLFLLLASVASQARLTRRNSTGLTDAVTWDPHSLSIHGQRIFILSAEFHPWRLPGNPDLWADVFQKIKANGFNTVSFYISWALHYPTPDTNDGNGDFREGTYRDIQRFIDEAKKAGLWMIARPGPYINGETTGGGFPGWVENIAGSLRTNNTNYIEAWLPYLTSISQIIAKNQVSKGGPIILVQAENEFSASPSNSPYMQDVIDTYRNNGIEIPITHNDQHSGQTGNFSPDLPGIGRVNVYCGDSYPQGSNSWAQVQSIYYSAHENVAPDNPLCLAEFGGGFLLNWGAVSPRGGTGYEKYSTDLTDADYENIFYKENYAQTATILNIYMLYGGTNWGQTAAPVSYTSYDYGGGINENRVAGPKMNEMRLQGLFLRVSPDLLGATLLANGTNYTTSPLIHTAELRNLQTGAGFYVTRHEESTSTAFTTTQLNVTTSLGSLLIPRSGVLTFDGRDSKIVVTDYVFGKAHIKMIYSTTEVMTWSTIGTTDYIVLYAPANQTGETSFFFSAAPRVNTEDAPNVSSSYSNGVLTLNYNLSGSQFIPVQGAASSLIVIVMDKATANQWHAPVIPNSRGTDFGNFFGVGTNQSVLVGGPYLVRTASITGNTLSLEGDLNGTTAIEFVAPPGVSRLTWNNASVAITKTKRNSFSASLNAPSQFTLPLLNSWKVSGSLPEINPSFDDSSFTIANLTSTNYTNLPPLAGSVVLYSQQYGFYGGNLIFRGHFTNTTGNETSITLTVQYGFAGAYSAWLNGVFIGSGLEGSATVSQSENTWTIPPNTLKIGAEENVLVVVQDHMGLSETSTNGGKEPRGIRGYAINGGNATFTSWKIQGNQGGAAHAPDTFRGYLNEGGLYGERIGAHLPGFPDGSWQNASSLSVAQAGINFFRTTFDLAIPRGIDLPVRLSFTPSDISSHYRVQIYLNGWQIGKYINNLGPQTVFVLPAGILRRSSTNTLVLSLWSLDANGASVPGVELIADGMFSSSLRFDDYVSPDYDAQRSLRPKAQYYPPL